MNHASLVRGIPARARVPPPFGPPLREVRRQRAHMPHMPTSATVEVVCFRSAEEVAGSVGSRVLLAPSASHRKLHCILRPLLDSKKLREKANKKAVPDDSRKKHPQSKAAAGERRSQE